MTFDTLDVVVVPFPFADRETSKRRPALVVSSADFNAAHEQSILTMITSVRAPWPSDVDIQDWQGVGLSVPCKVRFKLFTVDDGMIVRRIGSLSTRDARAIRTALSRVLATA
ncbi:MAG: type II toxin-antitoxin system PemK/MazF family toxin [Deltaproteobacteria bacterium]|nr:type II toxin-antitoxin system PemK/MazF family toxin [Deltaproteobacteria bacterium]